MEQKNLFNKAKAAAMAQEAPYYGALSAHDAYILWKSDPNAALIDVRTPAEWAFVGTIPNAHQLALKTFPNMQDNPDFMTQLMACTQPEQLVFMLCRTGARSHAAAVAAHRAGYSKVINIMDGFEGDLDTQQQRGNINGWQAAGLPWQQT